MLTHNQVKELRDWIRKYQGDLVTMHHMSGQEDDSPAGQYYSGQDTALGEVTSWLNRHTPPAMRPEDV